jgi:N-acetylglutamate synthase-like GNAT family acetyltransferase
MKINEEIEIKKAQKEDVNEMINLYRLVYGKRYPISYGTDPDLLTEAISNQQTHLCLVAKDIVKNVVAGAIIVEIDSYHKIGKLVGFVVHPDYQKKKIGQSIVQYVTKLLLEDLSDLNSLYATTRMVEIGVQVVFIKNNYLPLGIFPNAHRLNQYETVSLFARFRKGILEKRVSLPNVSKSLIPLYQIVKKLVPSMSIPKALDEPSITKLDLEQEWEFEIIQAPHYVYRKYLERFPNKEDRFFPFHSPNMLIADKNGRIEIFAYFSKSDGYCTLIKSTTPISDLRTHLTSLYMQLDDIGVAYLEVLVNVRHTLFIDTLLRGQFLPCAIYPAMRERNNFEDYVVMSRSMEPLNFRGMAIVAPFKPFVDQYVEAWKKVNLDSIEVIYEKK